MQASNLSKRRAAGLSQAVIDKMSALTGINGFACDSSTIYRILSRGG